MISLQCRLQNQSSINTLLCILNNNKKKEISHYYNPYNPDGYYQHSSFYSRLSFFKYQFLKYFSLNTFLRIAFKRVTVVQLPLHSENYQFTFPKQQQRLPSFKQPQIACRMKFQECCYVLALKPSLRARSLKCQRKNLLWYLCMDNLHPKFWQ